MLTYQQRASSATKFLVKEIGKEPLSAPYVQKFIESFLTQCFLDVETQVLGVSQETPSPEEWAKEIHVRLSEMAENKKRISIEASMEIYTNVIQEALNAQVKLHKGGGDSMNK